MNTMKVICSSSQSDVGVGNMFVITVNVDSDWYDYITEIDLPNRLND